MSLSAVTETRLLLRDNRAPRLIILPTLKLFTGFKLSGGFRLPDFELKSVLFKLELGFFGSPTPFTTGSSGVVRFAIFS